MNRILDPALMSVISENEIKRFQILKIEGQEADDVIATLTNQVLDKGMKVVIASPDKDFKQLISEDVQLVQPVPELRRWSFYTLKQYFAQYNCDPQSDLSLSEFFFFLCYLQVQFICVGLFFQYAGFSRLYSLFF